MMLFNELRKHGKLAAKRHPMYDKNRFGKYAMYAMAVFWAAYLIFFGTTFAFAFDTNSMEPYHIMNSGLVFVLALDFILRFPLQKTPTQEVKPYLLMPVRRNRVIDFLLIRSGLSSYNLIWLFIRYHHHSEILRALGSSHLLCRYLAANGLQQLLVSVVPHTDQ